MNNNEVTGTAKALNLQVGEVYTVTRYGTTFEAVYVAAYTFAAIDPANAAGAALHPVKWMDEADDTVAGSGFKGGASTKFTVTL